MRPDTPTALTLLFALLGTQPIHAASPDEDPERAALARLTEQLTRLEQLVDEAEAKADPDARVHFRYDWLRRDLRNVARGIEEHVEAPRTEPRELPPLHEDYRG